MKAVRFRQQARDDLKAIEEYYGKLSPDGLTNVLMDIFSSIDLLQDNPEMGMLISAKFRRRVITEKYRFAIWYDLLDDHIEVAGIYRYQNRTQ